MLEQLKLGHFEVAHSMATLPISRKTETIGCDPVPLRAGSPLIQSGLMEATLTKATLTLCCGDSREMDWIPSGSVHLVLTSPPYWTLKEYPRHKSQLGLIEDYDAFHDELDKVWKHAFRVLVPGGRLVCVVGDVCLSRRRHGKHSVMPLHADIVVRARKIGFDNLSPIFW